MDRLTGDFKGASMFATVEQARQYNRLRQYEDTGLMPDEIAALKADRDQWQDGTIIVKLADAEAEVDRLCAALKLAQARAADYEADIEAGNLVRLPGKLIAPYELNDRYWICGWDSERCTLIIQDRALMDGTARAALEQEATNGSATP